MIGRNKLATRVKEIWILLGVKLTRSMCRVIRVKICKQNFVVLFIPSIKHS